jgi:F0F1-type ATP synthase membrane subunit a
MRRLCSTVLGMEAVVVLLAIVPAKTLEHVSGGTAALVGGVIALLAILLAGVVGRPRMRWALYAGTILQFLVIASGVVIPAMYVLGVIFTALWFTGIWLARKVESANRTTPAA